METFFDEFSYKGKSLRTKIFLNSNAKKGVEGWCLFAYLIYAQFFKEFVDTGDVLSLQADLSRADYFENWKEF